MPKTAKIHQIEDQKLITVANISQSLRETMILLDLRGGTNYKILKQRLSKLNLLKKFDGAQFWNRGKTALTDQRIPSLERDAFSLNSRHAPSYIKRLYMKYMCTSYTCSVCGISSWNEKKLNLALDHINGDRLDNRVENLRLLCPNCHSQTETFCGKNISKKREYVPDEIIINAIVSNRKNIAAALRSVGLTPKGGNYSRCYVLINKHNL